MMAKIRLIIYHLQPYPPPVLPFSILSYKMNAAVIVSFSESSHLPHWVSLEIWLICWTCSLLSSSRDSFLGQPPQSLIRTMAIASSGLSLRPHWHSTISSLAGSSSQCGCIPHPQKNIWVSSSMLIKSRILDTVYKALLELAPPAGLLQSQPPSPGTLAPATQPFLCSYFPLHSSGTSPPTQSSTLIPSDASKCHLFTYPPV